MKNNHSFRKAILWAFAFFGVTACGVLSAISITQGGSGKQAFLSTRRNAAGPVALDPTQYEEVSSAHLVPEITDYTGTSLSRHLSVQFQSQIIQALSGVNKDVFYVVDDNNFSGDLFDPFAEEIPADKSLNAFIYYAKAASSTQTSLYFSNSIEYGTYFKAVTSKVGEHAMYQESEYDVDSGTYKVVSDSYQNLTDIYIFSGITEIEANALTQVPDTVTIHCEAAAKPEGWQDGWTDATNVEFGWAPAASDNKQKTIIHIGTTSSFGVAEDYILGYKGNEELGIGAYPLTVSYKKTSASGVETTVYQELPVKHKTNPYDAVGSSIYGTINFFEITIDLEKGDEVDYHSFEFYNIFKATRYYVNEKTAWPVEALRDVYKQYSLKDTDVNLPSVEGENFFHQTFETADDKYITVACEYDTEEAANEVVDTFKASLEAEGYTIVADFPEETFGNVYQLFDYKDEASQSRSSLANVFVQFYSILNENSGKYEFITYVVPDAMQLNDVLDEETKEPTGDKVIEFSRKLPLNKMVIATRPFIFIPVLDAETHEGFYKSQGAVRFSRMTTIDDVFSMQYAGSSSFLGYTSVSMKVDKLFGTAYSGFLADDYGDFDLNGDELIFYKGEDGKYYNGKTAYNEDEVKIVYSFPAPMPYIYNTSSRQSLEINLSTFKKGTIVFRYTFTGLNSSSLVVKYKKGNEVLTKSIPIKSPSPVIEVSSEKNNAISFMVNNSLLNGIDSKDILAFGVSGMTLNIHLFNTSSHSVVRNTNFLATFGNIEVLPESGNSLSYFSVDRFILFFYLGLTVVYALAATIIFFVRKEKYKNDEFRRMRPKAYLKSALLGFLGLLLVTAAVIFVVMRFAVFNSTVPTYNPIDAFVIAFGLAGAIALGFFIRALVVAIKLEKKRRESVRLKLDSDVVDDGTH